MNARNQSIIYTSPPAPVSMADTWYDIASIDHFWIRRRFRVLQKLADPLIREARQIAEVGCGNGLVQRCLEDYYHIEVAGFDLNEPALKRNVCRRSPLYCYDIHHRSEEFRGRFDVIIMFDVLEHIENDTSFLEEARFHLAKCGSIIINVPANQFLFSDYDRVVGHFRRYSMRSLERIAAESGLRIRCCTYWGATLIPFLILRKGILKFGKKKEEDIISYGLDPRAPFINRLLEWVSACEPIPQQLLGTSLMAVLETAG
jgi:SAM-dependent methyltransferase